MKLDINNQLKKNLEQKREPSNFGKDLVKLLLITILSGILTYIIFIGLGFIFKLLL